MYKTFYNATNIQLNTYQHIFDLNQPKKDHFFAMFAKDLQNYLSRYISFPTVSANSGIGLFKYFGQPSRRFGISGFCF